MLHCSSDRARPAETPPLHHKTLHVGETTKDHIWPAVGKSEKELANFKWHRFRISASCYLEPTASLSLSGRTHGITGHGLVTGFNRSGW